MAPRLEWIDRVGGIADIEGLQRPFGRITFTFGALVWSLDADFDRMKRVGLVDLYEP